jgi:selenide,water dikinase
MKPRTRIGSGVTDEDFLLLCDAQTSGGLLVALPEASAETYAARCRERGASAAAAIGRVVERGDTLLRVTR